MLVYAIYDEFIQHLLKGKTLLKINLKRKHRADAIIFILICIVIYTNIVRHGNLLTTYLLLITIFMSIYLAFIRTLSYSLNRMVLFCQHLYYMTE